MDARSLMALSRGGFGMTTLDGYHSSGMQPEEFRDAASSVTEDDLREIGIASNYRQPFNAAGRGAVDPATMKFDAMMALKKAKDQGMPTQLAQKRVDEADMFETGRQEVLRRRQNDFNAAARDRVGKPAPWNPLTGSGRDPYITALTGAAHSSQARAGQPQLRMPQEQHDPIYKTQSHLAGLGGPPEDQRPYMLSGLNRAKGRGY